MYSLLYDPRRFRYVRKFLYLLGNGNGSKYICIRSCLEDDCCRRRNVKGKRFEKQKWRRLAVPGDDGCRWESNQSSMSLRWGWRRWQLAKFTCFHFLEKGFNARRDCRCSLGILGHREMDVSVLRWGKDGEDTDWQWEMVLQREWSDWWQEISIVGVDGRHRLVIGWGRNRRRLPSRKLQQLG